MMTPKQKPVRPAPPMAPSCAPVKPNSAAHVARMPPRMPNPMPVARMARKPAHNSRWAFEAMASALAVALLMVVFFLFRRTRSPRTADTRSLYLFSGTFVRFSTRKSPLLPGQTRSRSPSASISATGSCMPAPIRPPKSTTWRTHSTVPAGALWQALVPVDAQRLLFAGIAAVVGHEALAGDEVQPPVPVEVHERRGVALRPGAVDRPPRPLAVTPAARTSRPRSRGPQR